MTNPLMMIRSPRKEEIPVIVRFNQLLALESENKVLDETILRRGVQRALSEPTLCRYFVAEMAGRVVGQTMVTYELTDWRDGVTWWIQSVYVEKGERGKGVFRALYQHIRRTAQADPDARAIRLYVEQHNQSAIATYRKLGMVDAGYFVYEEEF